jgi:hypothetical protein
LLFGVAMFFGVCFGVGREVSTTPSTYPHVETAAMWVWKHVEDALEYRSGVDDFQ